MPTDIFSQIWQAIQTDVSIIAVGLLLWVSPSLPMGWLKKLVWLSIAIGVWMIFVYPYQNGLRDLALYTLAIFVFPMLTEKTVILLYQAIIFLITYKLFKWIFEVESPRHAHHSPHASK